MHDIAAAIRDFFTGGPTAAQQVGGQPAERGRLGPVQIATAGMMALALAGCGTPLADNEPSGMHIAQTVHGDAVSIVLLDRALDRTCTANYERRGLLRPRVDLECATFSRLPEAQQAGIEAAVAGTPAITRGVREGFGDIEITYNLPDGVNLRGLHTIYDIDSGRVCEKMRFNSKIASSARETHRAASGEDVTTRSIGSSKHRRTMQSCIDAADATPQQRADALRLAARAPKPEVLAATRAKFGSTGGSW